MIISLDAFNLKYFHQSPPFSNDKKIKSISTFSVLVNQLKIILDKQIKFISTMGDTDKIAGVVFVFDHISDAENIEHGLQEKLLELGKVNTLLIS